MKTELKEIKLMDRLDYDLRSYYREEEETCENCGEPIVEPYYNCKCEDEDQEE
jgi:hypothetical protein